MHVNILNTDPVIPLLHALYVQKYISNPRDPVRLLTNTYIKIIINIKCIYITQYHSLCTKLIHLHHPSHHITS